MDESGDGMIGPEEMESSFKKISKDILITKQDATELIKAHNRKRDEESEAAKEKAESEEAAAELDYFHFLISTVNYKDRAAFMNYMEQAYKIFFDNEMESVST